MAFHTKIPVPSSAPLRRRHSPTVARHRVSESDSSSLTQRLSKSDPAAALMADRPHYATATKSSMGRTSRTNESASSKSFPPGTLRLRYCVSSKSIPHVSNRLYHSASSKSLGGISTRPPPSAPSLPLSRQTTSSRQDETLSTPLRGDQSALLRIHSDFVYDVQAWILGDVEDVPRKAKDHTRFEFHLRLDVDDEEVKVTEEMRRDLEMWIEAEDEETAKKTEVEEGEEKVKVVEDFWSDVMAYIDADDEEESRVATAASPRKMTTFPAAEVETAEAIKTGDIKLEIVRVKTTEGMRGDLIAWIDEDDDEEEGGVRIMTTPASPKKMVTITAAGFEATKTGDIKPGLIRVTATQDVRSNFMASIEENEGEEEGWSTPMIALASSAKTTTITTAEFDATEGISMANLGLLNELVDPRAQVATPKAAPAQALCLKAKAAAPMAGQTRLQLHRTVPSLAALMASAHDSDDDSAEDSDDYDCDSIAEIERKIGGARTSTSVTSGTLVDGPYGTRHTLSKLAYDSDRLRTRASENASHTPPRIIHIRHPSIDDALSDMSSTRTSVFSKQISVTTRSSHASINAVDGNYSRLIDALALEVNVNDTGKSATTDREPLLGNNGSLNFELNTASNNIGDLRNKCGVLSESDEEFEDLARFSSTPSTTSTSSSTTSLPSLHRVYADCRVAHEDLTTTVEAEVPQKPLRGNRWWGELKRQVEKVPHKTREVVKSTKRFTRTLTGFVPATMAARNPFQSL